MKRLLILLLLMVVGLSFLAMGYGNKTNNQTGRLAKTASRGDYVHITPNQITTYIVNNGSFNRNPGTGSAGFSWPGGSPFTAIYASGLWLGGKWQDTVRVAIAEYSYEYDAGPVGSNPQDSRFRMYVIHRGDNASNSADYANWPFQDGAPAVRTYNNAVDSLDESGNRIPLLIGDVTIWCVYNDANSAVHTNMGTPPIGVEVQQTAWAFNRSDALGNTIFYRWKIINKSGQRIDSMYTAIWSDCDIGGGNYDFDGCDTTLGLGFTYSGIAVNRDYGSQPPAAGFDFLQGPIVTSVGDTARLPDGRILPNKKILMMTSYLKYDNDASDLGNPQIGREAFNYFQGLTRTRQLITDPAGRPTRFMFSGDPAQPYNASTNWIENGTSGDRRLLMTAGPFEMMPNDTQDVVAGNLIASGASNIASVTALKDADGLVQLAYDLNFKLAPPPPTPRVEVAPVSNGIVLSWAKDEAYATMTENFWNIDPIAAKKKADSVLNFEGYVLYQFQNAGGANPRVIGTYDRVNGIKAILDSVFDSSLGSYVWRNVKTGNDNGLIRFIRLTRDSYTGQPFINNRDYYFAVTSYSYNPGSIPRTNESPINILTIRPQQQNMGTVFSSVGIDTIGSYSAAYSKTVVATTTGTNGYVTPLILNPDSVTGDTYQVRFDTTGGTTTWRLVDVTKNNTVKVGGRTNMTDDNNHPVIDGIMWKVIDAPVGVDYVTRTGSSIWITGDPGETYHFPYFYHGLLLGVDANNVIFNGWNCTYPFTQYKTVRLIIDSLQKGYAYRYRRIAGAGGPATGGYRMVYQNMVPTAFRAYDISNPASPRQLNIAFRDQLNTGAFDITNIYDLVLICNSSYDSTGATYSGNTTGGPFESDGMYVFSFSTRTGHTAYEAANTLEIKPFFINTVNDVFTINTANYKASPGNVDVAKTQIERIMVVPNPYFGANAYELNQFTKTVRLTNLPARATIRIYSLLGELIRQLEKNDPATTTFDWDLQNQDQLPVASGMYIIHIDMGDIGAKILKLAVIQASERLDNF